MFCEQNKSAQNGLAYKASDGNMDLTCDIQRKWKLKTELGLMGPLHAPVSESLTEDCGPAHHTWNVLQELTCRPARGRTSWLCPNLQIRHTHSRSLHTFSMGKWGNLPFIGTFKKVHIRRKEEEKKETGHKRQYCVNNYRSFLFCALRL